MPTPCDSVIRVTLDGKTDAFPVNTTVQTVISRLLEEQRLHEAPTPKQNLEELPTQEQHQQQRPKATRACGCRRPRRNAGRRVQGAERIPD